MHFQILKNRLVLLDSAQNELSTGRSRSSIASRTMTQNKNPEL